MCVCVYVCQCVFPALSGAGRWRGRIKLPRRASLVPAQARNQRCVCVCAHARVCLCGCCLVIITWLPPTPPPTPVEAGAPPPHTVPGSPVKSQFQCIGQTDTGRRSPAPSGPGGQRRTPSSTSFSDASYDQCSQLQPLPPNPNRTRIVGEVTFARFGHALTALGDLDGDGYDGQLTTVLFAMDQ